MRGQTNSHKQIGHVGSLLSLAVADAAPPVNGTSCFTILTASQLTDSSLPLNEYDDDGGDDETDGESSMSLLLLLLLLLLVPLVVPELTTFRTVDRRVSMKACSAEEWR